MLASSVFSNVFQPYQRGTLRRAVVTDSSDCTQEDIRITILIKIPNIESNPSAGNILVQCLRQERIITIIFQVNQVPTRRCSLIREVRNANHVQISIEIEICSGAFIGSVHRIKIDLLKFIVPIILKDSYAVVIL